jgi:hypothetical protein
MDTILVQAIRHYNVNLIYKPHPRAWNRKSKVTYPYKHTKFFDGTDYDQLLLLADGLITPFSSMILEFALIGKPSLAIFINDNINDWKFSEMNNEEHIKMLIEHNWLNVCKENDKLEGLFEKFLENLYPLLHFEYVRLRDQLGTTGFQTNCPSLETLLRKQGMLSFDPLVFGSPRQHQQPQHIPQVPVARPTPAPAPAAPRVTKLPPMRSPQQQAGHQSRLNHLVKQRQQRRRRELGDSWLG